VWLVTRDGFYSVVEERKTDGKFLLVRTRAKGHAVALLDVLGRDDIKVQDDKRADYRYRVSLPREEWKRYLDFAADDINYDSHFKEVVRDAQPKHLKEKVYSAMLSTWTAFARVQPTRPYSGTRQR
jgi:hypothetical protein